MPSPTSVHPQDSELKLLPICTINETKMFVKEIMLETAKPFGDLAIKKAQGERYKVQGKKLGSGLQSCKKGAGLRAQGARRSKGGKSPLDSWQFG